MGGSGVQRPLKFVKYLREFGWNPIVLRPEPGIYSHFDDSLERELKKTKVEVISLQPQTPFHVAAGSNQEKYRERKIPDWLAKIVRRFLRLFMFPDNKKGWIEPAYQKAVEIIENRDVDLIFSTAPPFSNHVAAAKISDQTNLPLILDYRDLWLNNHFMDDMFGWQKRRMKKLEEFCLQRTKGVTALDDFMIDDIRSCYPEIDFNGFEVSHGFDPEDFENLEGKATLEYRKGKLNFLYSGLFYEQNQPDILLKALVKAANENALNLEQIHLHFQGGLDVRIQHLVEKLGLSNIVTDYGYVNHEIATANLLEADVLWMISNFDAKHKQIKSGKLFEYIGTGKPILGLLHPGEASRLLEQYGAGFVGNLSTPEKVQSTLETIFEQWEKDQLPEANKEFIALFDRKKLTLKLAKIFDKISSQ